MKSQALKSDSLLFLTALIWGTAFVAQRVGMDHVGPFTYNGVRFFLGSLALLPLVLWSLKNNNDKKLPPVDFRAVASGGLLAGAAIFVGASLQQVGLVYTTAGKAGFITGLYVVIVPLMGLFFRHRPGAGTFSGAFLAAAGLYLLSVTESFTIQTGDFLELIGAFFWAAHVLVLAWLSPKINPIILAFSQFLTCSILSLLTAVVFETITVEGLISGAFPIAYGGLVSVGIAYTLQVVAQKHAPPSHAAIILSLEAVFAALGGWLILGETLSNRGLAGCALMLGGMLFSQIQSVLALRKSGVVS